MNSSEILRNAIRFSNRFMTAIAAARKYFAKTHEAHPSFNLPARVALLDSVEQMMLRCRNLDDLKPFDIERLLGEAPNEMLDWPLRMMNNAIGELEAPIGGKVRATNANLRNGFVHLKAVISWDTATPTPRNPNERWSPRLAFQIAELFRHNYFCGPWLVDLGPDGIHGYIGAMTEPLFAHLFCSQPDPYTFVDLTSTWILRSERREHCQAQAAVLTQQALGIYEKAAAEARPLSEKAQALRAIIAEE